MKLFLSKMLASAAFSAMLIEQVMAQSAQFPQPVIPRSPLSQGGGQTLVLPFTNGGEAVGQFNASSAELIEGFDTTTLNTTNTWRVPTVGTTGNAVTAGNTAADTILSGGTTAGGWSLLQSIKVFTEDNPGYQFFQTNVNITPTLGGAATGSCMFFGFGTVPANPSCGSMGVNAAGFETTATGSLLAVTYASSGRVVVSDLSIRRGNQPVITNSSSAGQPLSYAFGCNCTPQATFVGDTGSHKVGIYMRGDNIVYTVEEDLFGFQVPVAETIAGSIGLDVNAVPVSFLVVAGAGVATAGLLQINQVTVARTSGKMPAVTPVTTGATGGTGLVLKSYPGALLSTYATNLTATAGFLAILNLTAIPTAGAALAPVDCIPLPASGQALINNRGGLTKHYNVGMTAVITTSCASFTAGAAAFISGDVQ